MKRQRFISITLATLFLATLLIGTLTSCGKKPDSVQAEKTKLSLWFYWDQGSCRSELKNLIEEFNSSQDEIEVEAQYVPDEDFKKKLLLSIADDTMPDLALVNSADFRYFHAMQPFVELTEVIGDKEQYLPQVIECCTINEEIYGFPVGFHCSVLYYNTSILYQHNVEVPQTWEELCQAAEALTDDEHYGLAIPAVESEDSVYNFLPFLWSAGGDVDHIDSEESRRAFELLRRLEESGGMSRQIINLTAGDLVAQFVEGNIAMMVNESTMIQSIREKNPRMNFGIDSLPVYEEGGETVSIIGGEILSVTQGEHQEEALRFLEYVSGEERIEAHASAGGFMSPRRSVLEDSFADDPQKQKVQEIAQYARTREFSTVWPAISAVLNDAIEEEIIGTREEEEILTEAAEKIKEIREEGL